MPKVTIIPTEYDHLLPVAKDMREADVLEVSATGNLPYESLTEGFNLSSRCWTGLVDNRPAAIFGVAPMSVLGGVGSPWLLGTDTCMKVKREFLTGSKPYVEQMLGLYPRLVNYVDVRNTASIRWLKWLGFEIHEPIPFGLSGELFHPFEMMRAQ